MKDDSRIWPHVSDHICQKPGGRKVPATVVGEDSKVIWRSVGFCKCSHRSGQLVLCHENHRPRWVECIGAGRERSQRHQDWDGRSLRSINRDFRTVAHPNNCSTRVIREALDQLRRVAGKKDASLRYGSYPFKRLVKATSAVCMQMSVRFIKKKERRCIKAGVGDDLDDLKHPR